MVMSLAIQRAGDETTHPLEVPDLQQFNDQTERMRTTFMIEIVSLCVRPVIDCQVPTPAESINRF